MSRRYKRKKPMSKFKKFLLISLAIAVLMSFAIGSAVGQGNFNSQTFIITFFVSLVSLCALSIVLSLPYIKGKRGEKQVSKVLNRLAKKYDGYVINDVIIPGEGDKTSQIDHVFLSRSGFFVIETKNYAGYIYGAENQQQWTQVLAYGKKRCSFYNPIKQNQTHIVRLNKLTDEHNFFKSIVVFTNGNISHVSGGNVCTIRKLAKTIENSANSSISEIVVNEVYSIINGYKLNPIKTNKEHVKEIKQMAKDIDNNICPRCGGKLVLRTSRDGRQFYGCSNYPRCTFIKKK